MPFQGNYEKTLSVVNEMSIEQKKDGKNIPGLHNTNCSYDLRQRTLSNKNRRLKATQPNEGNPSIVLKVWGNFR